MWSRSSESSLQSSPMPGTSTWVSTKQTLIRVWTVCGKTSWLNWTVSGECIHNKRKGTYPARNWWICETWSADHLSARCTTRPLSTFILPSSWRYRKEIYTTKKSSSRCKKTKSDSKQSMWLCSPLCRRGSSGIAMSSLPIENRIARHSFSGIKMFWLISWKDTKLSAKGLQSFWSMR